MLHQALGRRRAEVHLRGACALFVSCCFVVLFVWMDDGGRTAARFSSPPRASMQCIHTHHLQTNKQTNEHQVDHHYWYQLYLDDLPIWGMVGEAGDEGKKVRAYVGGRVVTVFVGGLVFLAWLGLDPPLPAAVQCVITNAHHPHPHTYNDSLCTRTGGCPSGTTAPTSSR